MPEHIPGRVSVVMPCFNGQETIERSIKSVLAQTYLNVELLVINDGSTDDSEQVIQSIESEKIRYLRQGNAGVSSARNKGIELAKGEFIAFLDADDTWEPVFLEKLVGVLKINTSCILAYCGWQNLGKAGSQSEPFVPPEYEIPNKLEKLFEDCRWPIHAVVTRAHGIKKVGGFNRMLSNAEDFLLWLEIAALQPICRVPEVLAYYCHHGQGQASQNLVKAAMDHLRAQSLFIEHHPDIKNELGRHLIRRLSLGRLLKKGYELYWRRELIGARAIFRLVMLRGYGGPKDWLYMLPSWLPLTIHRMLIGCKL